MIWNLLVKPLKLGMLSYLILFLTACQTTEVPTRTEKDMRIKWHFHEVVPNELMGCLKIEDVKKLRKELLRCQDQVN